MFFLTSRRVGGIALLPKLLRVEEQQLIRLWKRKIVNKLENVEKSPNWNIKTFGLSFHVTQLKHCSGITLVSFRLGRIR